MAIHFPQKITPFLWFDKNAEEAINLYVSIFKNARIVDIQRYPEGPLEGPMAGMEGKVLTATFDLEGQRFFAIDGGPMFQPSTAVSFYITCDTQEEVDHYWNALSQGGDPNAQQCGWLKDKFGFSWQVVPKQLPEYLMDSDKAKAGRVMAAMMQMKKIVIADLDSAAASQ